MGQLALLLKFYSYTRTRRYADILFDPLYRYHPAQCNQRLIDQLGRGSWIEETIPHYEAPASSMTIISYWPVIREVVHGLIA